MAQSDLSSKLDSFKAGVAQAPKVADATSTLVTTKAKDTLMAVDGYGKTATQTLTNMKNDLQNRIAAAKNWLFNTEIGDLGSLHEALDKVNGIKKDITALNNQLSDAIGSSIATVRGINDAVLSQAQDNLALLNKIPFDVLQNGKGNALRVILGATSSEANGLIDSVSRIIPTLKGELTRYDDYAANVALKVGLLKNAAGLGMTDVINGIMKTDPTNVVMKTALIDQFDQAILNGDLTIINSIVDNLGVEFTLGRYPNAVGEILQSYRMPLGTTAADYTAAGVELIRTLSRFNPNWDKASSNASMYNLAIFSMVSPDVKLALKTNKDYQRILAVASHYTPTALVTQARQMYPYAVL